MRKHSAPCVEKSPTNEEQHPRSERTTTAGQRKLADSITRRNDCHSSRAAEANRQHHAAE